MAEKEDELIEVAEEVQTVQADPMVDKARGMGWVPEEEYQGDPDTWVPAKEFVGRAPLYEAIHKSNRKLKELQSEMEASKKFHGMIAENAKKVALKELQDRLDQAADRGDIKEVIQVQREIDKQEAVQQTPSTQDASKEIFNTWLVDNQWYKTSVRLKQAATEYGADLRADYPEMPFDELLSKVTEKMKEEFPEKFNSKPTQQPTVADKKKATAVASPSPGASAAPAKASPAKVSADRLPNDARKIYNQLVLGSNKVMDHDTFMKEYVASGGLLEK